MADGTPQPRGKRDGFTGTALGIQYPPGWFFTRSVNYHLLLVATKLTETRYEKRRVRRIFPGLVHRPWSYVTQTPLQEGPGVGGAESLQLCL